MEENLAENGQASSEVAQISDHILEIRYKPDPQFLDYRGAAAEKLARKLSIKDWHIDENRVQLIDTAKQETVFVSFRNAGLGCKDASANYFPKRAREIVEAITEIEILASPLPVERIGVRFRFYSRYEGSFEELRERFLSRYFILAEPAKAAFSLGDPTEVIDIGFDVNFKDDAGNFNTKAGPMAKEQVKQFLKSDKKLPDVGLYFDIDYWYSPASEITTPDLLSRIKEFGIRAWDRHERFKHFISD